MLRNAAFLIALSLMIVPAALRAQNESKQNAGVAAAGKWLSLVDTGQYAESWRQAAAYFRQAVTEKKWEESLEAFRKPLGKLEARRLQTSAYKTALPGAPDGEYVVMRFHTAFERKKSAVETVTMVREEDGDWRADGYYIR